MALLFAGRKELLDRGEDNPARCCFQQLPQMSPALGLHRLLTQQLLAPGKGPVELVIEVISVRDHNQCGILHRRVLDDAASIKGHREALARPLRMPNHARAPVAARAGRFHRGFHGKIHRVVLVIARHLLHEGAAAAIFEHDEIADQIQEPAFVEHPLQDDLKLRKPRVGKVFSLDGSPGHKPLPVGGQGPNARLDAIRDDERLVEQEE